MIPELRNPFNAQFTDASYQTCLDWIANQSNHRQPFRIAETPVFIPKLLKERLVTACEEIVDVIVRPDFKELSDRALLSGQTVPGETPHSTFLQFDFGVCIDKNGDFTPQLIEAQGFPSLYFFQDLLAKAYRQHFDLPEHYTHLFGGLDSENYIEKLRRIIIGDHDPEQVILLEIEPEKQTTAIDFICAKKVIGIEYICISKLKKEGKDVFYYKDGRKIQVKRIFNRVIFDELIRRDDLKREFYLTHEHNVEWVGHPNWFFRLSKHTLPLLKSEYVPQSFYLDELKEIPTDLQNYVLKPLYSFAGTGVIINLNRFDIEAITDPENYILQRKVQYAPVIPTPDGPSKCEIRMMLLWEPDADRPKLVNNLIRLSKGEMVGVRYNKDKTWVGGSVGFFEQ
ncbi:MAG: hypothetical protein DHS20C18_51020 [Saprospiraceae bacterium]|nr:MAG: hypothetical protein DHS20C18_51020 [Saprospiraceae bacterium]